MAQEKAKSTGRLPSRKKRKGAEQRAPPPPQAFCLCYLSGRGVIKVKANGRVHNRALLAALIADTVGGAAAAVVAASAADGRRGGLARRGGAEATQLW